MSNQEIRDLLAEQLLRLQTAARTHDHPRVQTAVSCEMTAIARVLLDAGTPAQAQTRDTLDPAKLGELLGYLTAARKAACEVRGLAGCGNHGVPPVLESVLARLETSLRAAQALAEGLVQDEE